MAHVGQELALGHICGFGAGYRLLQRVFGQLAFRDVFRDRQQIGAAVGVAHGDLLLAQEPDAPGGADRLRLDHLDLAGLEHLPVHRRRSGGLFCREDLFAGLAEVLAAGGAVHLLHSGIEHDDPSVSGVLHRQPRRHVFDHGLQERPGALQFLGRQLSLGHVVRDCQDIGRSVRRLHRHLHLPKETDAVVRRGQGSAFLDQHFSGVDDPPVLGDQPVHLLRREQVSRCLADHGFAGDAHERFVGPVHDHDLAVDGVLHHQGDRHALDQGLQERPRPFQLLLGPKAVGDVFADDQQVLGTIAVVDGHLGLADDAHAFAAGMHRFLLDDRRFAADQQVPIFFGDRTRLLVRHQIGDGPADVFGRGDAVELLHGPVHHQDLAGRVLDDQRRRRALQDAVQERAGAADFLLGFHLSRNVARDDQQAADLTLGVSPGRRIPHHPAGLAIGQRQAFWLTADGLPLEAAPVQGAVADLGVGRELIGGAADEILFRQAEVGQEERARLDESQVQIGHGDGDRRSADEGLHRGGFIDRRPRGRAAGTPSPGLWGSVGAHC